ncbi:hypothetical protein B0H19DRAFT_1254758 [Mycena capillaripes]|nr:hypothetical protein B0H19DRAFT_1254758 [Mycena capillaripes]
METVALDNQQSTDASRKQKIKLQKLGRVVHDLLVNIPATTQRTLESHGIHNLQSFLSSSDVPSDAFWDEQDNVYRCSECMWELEHGICSSCGLEFDIDPRDDMDCTTNEAFNPDRVSEPRGDTPLPEDDDERYFVPSVYTNKREEYEELRRRGATRLMCETFHLEFDPDTGIIAWADGALYDEFPEPLMQNGDFWKIMLGRRINLDEEDLDGSQFIEALLEDTIVFPLIPLCNLKWETVEETPGIWVTRIMDVTPQSPASASGDESNESTVWTESEDSLERRMQEVQEAYTALEPGYAAAALPVHAHHHEVSGKASDTESDDEVDAPIKEERSDETLDEEEADDADPSWAWEAVSDNFWVPRAT